MLEPLIPSVKANLDHRHSYVRRNAIMCLHSVFKDYEFLCPDAPSLVFQALLNVKRLRRLVLDGSFDSFCYQEGDASCKRNAFIMLCGCDQDKAAEYLDSMSDQVRCACESLFEDAID